MNNHQIRYESEFNPTRLMIELFCRGLRAGDGVDLERIGRSISRTRAGLGSGLELVIVNEKKNVRLNAPIYEKFAADSPFELKPTEGGYYLRDGRDLKNYPVIIPQKPNWYDRKTTGGLPMSRVGVLQGTYLAIYLEKACSFWSSDPPQNCAFCTTGINIGAAESESKSIADVVETARAAKEESGVTFIHFNGGFLNHQGLQKAAPYIKAVAEEVGLMVGLQMAPAKELWQYDWLLDLGVNHFSICYELHNPDYFARHLPGKQKVFGQQGFFRALEYLAKKSMRGSISGEIIAGIEPVEDTRAAIDYITSLGAFPTVCIFRPTIGSGLEDHPSPNPEDIEGLMLYAYRALVKNRIPIGLAPNLDVSIIVQPTDMQVLAEGRGDKLYRAKNKLMSLAARPIFKSRLKPRKINVPVDGDYELIRRRYQ